MDNGAWSTASYQGEILLRKTAWTTLRSSCTCEYGYSDTWQQRVTSVRMQQVLETITACVEKACGLEGAAEGDGLNSVNLNYYPRGGGVGFHADDEFLFDGLERDAAIVSLSLCSGAGACAAGERRFEVRLKKAFQVGCEPLEADTTALSAVSTRLLSVCVCVGVVEGVGRVMMW